MKNRLIITVSDVSGTKSYNVHQFIRKFVVIFSIIALFVLGLSFWLITYLHSEVSNIKESKREEIAQLTKKEKELLAQNSFYSKQIQGKIEDIEELSSKLDHLEEIIGIKKDEDIDLIKRATLATMTTVEKVYMLRTIPNGSPLKLTRVTSNYGYRIHPISNKKIFHRGIDLKAAMRTEIFATADGVVSYVEPNDRGGFGRVIKIMHGYGFQTLYAHLNKTKVKIGQVVKKGDLIGLSGNSGNSSGPHLHYEMRYGTKVLNPRDFIFWDIKNYESIFKKQRRIPWESLVNLISEHNKIVRQ
ncbi:M23 family metallopeptidase [Malaciobacter mytili]|uniref:Peptidase n=1 Tax=Malaciobacter mytili LMG 24559 TaxID=1032238 RepID=A0AAX2AIX5_9BACT|nr:M23 family metallopeptidase [Malaciobacter mytili]AXH14110.1 zinc metallopeptidase, M23 family [Malaciobacter mytili LMG 24559]RXI46696.1 peptidase [Malaciobacter mytili]RXK16987.1 peptidase [Malaciobacter mytili LMG 24559]